ncbi:hypothetical protein GCM10027614_20770 [Micromonospora vulcania]
MPEIGGAIDPDNEAHELVMSIFGGMSNGERNRIKVRVRTATAAQTLLEGRHLGGRLPYGYTLRGLGPHPSTANANSARCSRSQRAPWGKMCPRGIRTLVRIIGAPFRVHMLIDYGTFRVGSTSRPLPGVSIEVGPRMVQSCQPAGSVID